MKRCNKGIFGGDGNDVCSVVVLVRVELHFVTENYSRQHVQTKTLLSFFHFLLKILLSFDN